MAQAGQLTRAPRVAGPMFSPVTMLRITILVVLIALSALFFAVTIVKMIH